MKTLFKSILTILLMSGIWSNVYADETIDTSSFIYSTLYYLYVLGTPRTPLIMMSDSGHVIIHGDAFAHNLQLYYDAGVTLLDDYNLPVTHNHTHMNVYNDTIYIGSRRTTSSNDSVTSFTFVDNGASTYLDVPIATDTLNNGVTAGIFCVNKLPNTDSIIGLYNYDGGTGLANNLAVMSADNGASWGDTVRVVDNTGLSIVRAGCISSNEAYYAVIFESGTIDSIMWYERRPDSSWHNEGGLFNSGRMDRGYTYTIYDDTLLFCMTGSVPTADSLYLYYGWKHVDSDAAWNTDSMYVGKGYPGSVLSLNGTSLTYMESGKKLVGTYVKYANDAQTDDSTAIYAMAWDFSTMNWDGNQVRISSKTKVINNGVTTPAAPTIVPPAWGDQFLIMYTADDGALSYDVIITTVTVSSTATGSQIIMVE